jgi:20S proteasome alpha/beta subunit
VTICIAALCEDSKAAIISSDRMLTAGDTEFEHDTPKMYSVTDTCIALSAGSALHQIDLIRGVRDRLTNTRNPSVVEVVDVFKARFVELRRTIAEEIHLSPLGLDLPSFIARQDRLSESLVLRLTRALEMQSLELELLIVGVDASGAHIYHICDPGTSACFDAVGFCAIGSGERHADLTFIRSGYSPRMPLGETVFLTYQAKRDAEMAPGVGERYTDIGAITSEGFKPFDERVIGQLADAYKKLSETHASGHGFAQETIDRLFDDSPDYNQQQES